MTSKLQVEATRVREALAQTGVANTVIRAPFDGVIAARAVNPAEYLLPGRKVASLVDPSTLRLRFAVPDALTVTLPRGERAEFSVARAPERSFTAVIERPSPAVDAVSRDQLVEAVVERSDPRLGPGLFATCRLVTGNRVVPVVPSSAVFGGAASQRVFVVRNHRLEERLVRAREARDGKISVLNGLAAGEVSW